MARDEGGFNRDLRCVESVNKPGPDCNCIKEDIWKSLISKDEAIRELCGKICDLAICQKHIQKKREVLRRIGIFCGIIDSLISVDRINKRSLNEILDSVASRLKK